MSTARAGMGPLQARLASALRLARDVAAKNAVELRNVYDVQSSADNEDARESSLEPHKLVFGALKEAMRTLLGLGDQESAWLYSQRFWPYVVHDREEQLAIFMERLQRIMGGEESIQYVKDVASPEAIGRMVAVFEVYPKCLTGQNRQRDWKILCFLAQGYTAKIAGGLVGASHLTVANRRDVQCRQIATLLADLMPGPTMPRILAPPVPAASLDSALDALALSEAKLKAKGRGKPEPRHVVLEAIASACRTAKSLSAASPTIPLLYLKRAFSVEDDPRLLRYEHEILSSPAMQARRDVVRMRAISEIFPACLDGKNRLGDWETRRRDWEVLIQCGWSEMTTVDELAIVCGMSRSLFLQIKRDRSLEIARSLLSLAA